MTLEDIFSVLTAFFVCDAAGRTQGIENGVYCFFFSFHKMGPKKTKKKRNISHPHYCCRLKIDDIKHFNGLEK